ncbi:MAG: radical SAM protein, partial [Candidatus Omnitrophica bacterium]|nr:radical SAM protein [Candidatus Omnitrophota bacterium]
MEIFKPREKECFIADGRLKIIASASGIHILWDGVEITSGTGLNIAVNTLGLWTDSTKAEWLIVEKTPRLLKCKAYFEELPLFQVWTVKIEDEGTISWQVDMEISEWLHIDEFRIVCFVNPDYKTWLVNNQQAYFQCADESWHDLYMSDEAAYTIGVRFPAKERRMPAFILENQYCPASALVQNPPASIGGRIVGLRFINPEDKKSYNADYYHVFNGKIRLYKEEAELDAKMEIMRLTYLDKVMKDATKKTMSSHKLRILLANLPWRKDGRAGVRAGSRWPHIKDESEGDYLPFPFFMAHATALLKKHGIDATLIDAIAEELTEEAFLDKISRMDFDYLVTETSIPSYYYDLNLLQNLARRGIHIILCGPNSEIYEARFLKEHPFIDFVLYGEYEFTLLELVQFLQESRNLFNITGLIYNDNGQIRKNPPRPAQDINLLPWPQREGLPMQKYLDAPGEMFTPSVQIMASRGCPFGCQFCLWPQVMYQGHHYRVRTVKDVIDEMEYLVRQKGFRSVYFDDDTFNIGKSRMLSFCQEIRERGLDKVQWAIMARPDLMDEEILDNMKKAGLWAVKYGMESANQHLVDNIGKSMDLKKAEKMIRYTQKLGIKTHLTFTFGLPGETKQTIAKTIKYVEKLDPFSVQFSITTPFPGT